MIILAVTAHHASSVILIHSHEEEQEEEGKEQEEEDCKLWLANESDHSGLPSGCCSSIRIKPAPQRNNSTSNTACNGVVAAELAMLASMKVKAQHASKHGLCACTCTHGATVGQNVPASEQACKHQHPDRMMTQHVTASRPYCIVHMSESHIQHRDRTYDETDEHADLHTISAPVNEPNQRPDKPKWVGNARVYPNGTPQNQKPAIPTHISWDCLPIPLCTSHY